MQDSQTLTPAPISKDDLEAQARRLLRDAGVLGILPTPLDVLAETAGIKCYKNLPDTDGFLKTLTAAGQRTFIEAIQKVRGIADLREKVVYIPAGQAKPKERFAQAHEISHQIIPWHDVGHSLIDTEITLSPEIKEEFEREANFCGADLLFQGDRFQKLARDYTASIDSVLHLADMHETSYQSTMWKFAQVQDERVCVAQYYPRKEQGDIFGYRLWKCIGSPAFSARYANIDIPRFIDLKHDWSYAAGSSSPVHGLHDIACGDQKHAFEWSAWSNSYALFVMLRRKPLLHMVRGILSNSKVTKGIIFPTE